MAIRENGRRQRKFLWMPVSADEYYLDIYRRILDLSDPFCLWSVTLHHDYRYSVRTATFQNGRFSFDSFRENDTIDTFKSLFSTIDKVDKIFFFFIN